ncbi:EamA family transporter [Clostridiales bacterium]|nr:EamA family transporter [Clostridiales bacterium]
MNTLNQITPQQALEKRKIRYAATGLLWACSAAVTWAFYGNIMGVAGGMSPFSDPAYTVAVIAVASIVTGCLNDLFSGIWVLIINLATGRSLKEYGRLLKTKIGAATLLAAFFGGPFATGASLIAINLCEPTYALAIGGTSPIVGAIAGRILFKENLNARIWLGIVIAVAGVLIVSWAPPTGKEYPYFAIGLLFAVLSSVGWGIEGVCCIYAADMTDSATACGIYRSFGSGLMFLILFVPAAGLIAGDATLGFSMMAEAFSAGTPILWILAAMRSPDRPSSDASSFSSVL